MKKWISLLLVAVWLLSLTACTPLSFLSDDDPGDTSTTTPTLKTDDWYSEEEGVRGRIWLGMTEKELCAVLYENNIEITAADSTLERDAYGAEYLSSDDYAYYRKRVYTKGHQSFYFDENDTLAEIHYSDQLRATMDPINEEFRAQRGVQRRGTYQEMIDAYGEPDQVIEKNGDQSCVYHLENGDYLHFVYQGLSQPILFISYCRYPIPYSVW